MSAERSPAPFRLSPEQETTLFMLLVKDDTEDAPWMVMGDAQFWAASSLAHSLRVYAHTQPMPWYVASMLPINYRWRDSPTVKTVAPDLFVAFVEERPRQSFDATAEGGFPPIVLEIVSPASVERDLRDKLIIYEEMGVQEYALLRTDLAEVRLEGYRRGESGKLDLWLLDAEGRLWSKVLGLFLLVREGEARAMTGEGQLLLTPEQTELARRDAEIARQEAEDEATRLRAELERLRRPTES